MALLLSLAFAQWVGQIQGRGTPSVPTWNGFLFLAIVLDIWSRRAVGWARETPEDRADPQCRAGDLKR